MNRDHIEGGIRNLRGRAKTALGAVGGSPRPQVEGAIDQAAGAAQYAYGRARDTARDLRRDGEHLVDEARERGQALAEDLTERGRHYRGRGQAIAGDVAERGRHYRARAEQHGRAVAQRAEDNKATTLAVVAAVAFGLGWLLRPSR
ncbi:CsbD family protein [Methylobacterium trifolii]|uniref:CsbD family protein n=1 Tax=Methylobacterium trifolii TaxID=1003092 RepID=A0ABQ4TZ37_9HYPH|nr:CsbD family protein [Methylobacterium trifolii]GJE59302.1 hypothetical protein MPOCJGCO_1390 [Methylobacterium trifolii]